MDLPESRADRNLLLGRAYYSCMVDAAGYPNGMSYWEELPEQEKYYYCALAIDTLEKLSALGMDPSTYGFRDPVSYSSGDCLALRERIAETQEAGIRELEDRIARFSAAYRASTEGEPDAD